MLPLRLLSTQSDARLLELAAQGHERAFEALVKRYLRPLLSYARRRLLLPEARAEDALQQAFLSAWLALQRGTEVKDARAWLYRIVHNAGVSALRRSGYDYDELHEASHGAEAPDDDLERRTVVRQTLIGLAAAPPEAAAAAPPAAAPPAAAPPEAAPPAAAALAAAAPPGGGGSPGGSGDSAPSGDGPNPGTATTADGGKSGSSGSGSGGGGPGPSASDTAAVPPARTAPG